MSLEMPLVRAPFSVIGRVISLFSERALSRRVFDHLDPHVIQVEGCDQFVLVPLRFLQRLGYDLTNLVRITLSGELTSFINASERGQIISRCIVTRKKIVFNQDYQLVETDEDCFAIVPIEEVRALLDQREAAASV